MTKKLCSLLSSTFDPKLDELTLSSLQGSFMYFMRFRSAWGMPSLHRHIQPRKKKSKKGIQTPKQDLDLIKRRFQQAQDDYQQLKNK